MSDIQNMDSKSYLHGFVGAALFSIFGIAITVFVLNVFHVIIGWIVFFYVFLAKKGYKVFDGKLDRKGDIIAIIAAVLMSLMGIFVAYSFWIYRELSAYISPTFDLIMSIYKEQPEVRKELLTNCGISLGVSLLVMFYSMLLKRSPPKNAQFQKLINKGKIELLEYNEQTNPEYHYLMTDDETEFEPEQFKGYFNNIILYTSPKSSQIIKMNDSCNKIELNKIDGEWLNIKINNSITGWINIPGYK